MVRLRRLPVLFWFGVAGYVCLTAVVAAGVLDAADRAVLDFCRDHHSGTLAAAADHFTDVFSPEADVAILLVLLGAQAWFRRRPYVFVPAAAIVGVGAGVVLATKAALGRPLPNTPALDHADGFPSGHTAMFLISFGVLVLLTTRRHPSLRTPLLGVVALGTLLIAASLVYDGFHWLTDTLASVSLATGLLSLLQFWLRRRTGSRRSAADTPPTGRSSRRR